MSAGAARLVALMTANDSVVPIIQRVIAWGEAVDAAEADKGNEALAKVARERGGEVQYLARAVYRALTVADGGRPTRER